MKYQIAWSADRPRPFTDCATASPAPECLFAATVVRHMRETMAWFRRNTEIVMAHKGALLTLRYTSADLIATDSRISM